jgi:hypothetical protein
MSLKILFGDGVGTWGLTFDGTEEIVPHNKMKLKSL